jgi:CheY-like chemotaxis protein
VAAGPGSPRAAVRVLVVDDHYQVRTLMRRMLAGAGYTADVAASVPEARLMNPAGYDVVVVDAHLGEERGATLIAELAAQDPAAPRRCLLVTGGGPGLAPPGVAYLAKPFQPSDLVAAVQALHAPGPAAPGPGNTPADPAAPAATAVTAAERRPQHPGPGPAAGSALAGSALAGFTAAGSAPAGPLPAARQLIGLAGRLRAGERAAVAGLLHDGAVQELTAAMLSLEMLARRAPDDLAPCFGQVRQQLAAVAQPLRQLVDDWAPVMELDAGLPGTVTRRTAWLPFRSVTTEVQHLQSAAGSGAPAGPRLPPDIVDIIELALFLIAGQAPPGQADVLVRAGEQGVEILLTLTVTPGVTGDAGHPAALEASLAGLASALGGRVSTRFGAFPWRAQIRLPGRPLLATAAETQKGIT